VESSAISLLISVICGKYFPLRSNMFSAPPAQRKAKRPARSRILAQIVAKVMGQITLNLPVAASLTLPMAAMAAESAPEGIAYKVVIEAPSPLDVLLQNNLDLLRFRGNPRIDREQLQRLVRSAPEQIKTLVSTAGYYTPQVSARLDNTTPPTVLVNVDPGPPVLVGSVELVLQGFDPLPGGPGAASPSAAPLETPFDKRALEASWGLPEGQIFRQSDWEQSKRNLLRQVVQTRYPRAQLSETQATVDPEAHSAALRVVLDSGPELRFGELRIEGLRRYPASIVRNLNQIKPGDYYSEAALQAYQARLQDSGYFSGVEVSADQSSMLSQQIEAAKQAQPGDPAAPAAAASPPPAVMAPLPLVVKVTENKEKNVTAGLGYSTNTGDRAQLNYDDLSVFGLKFKSALIMESKRQSAHADFFFPATADGYNDSVGASFERNDIAGETTRVSGVAAKRTWGTTLLERSLIFEYLNEIRSVNGVEKGRSKSLPLTFGLTKRHLDNLLFPSRGYVFNAQLGGAVLPLLTDEKFLRASTRGIVYLPLDKRSTVILRGEAGALSSKNKAGVPSTFLFRAGGDQSVRGYAYQELGVLEDGATVVGRYLATASAEYQYWVTPTWGAATFYDAGNAADTVKDLRPKTGYGVGVRYKSPVGPINVDVAYGHPVKDGVEVKQIRLHFSLGFTF
jgi:translocation and assembly module TamA